MRKIKNKERKRRRIGGIRKRKKKHGYRHKWEGRKSTERISR